MPHMGDYITCGGVYALGEEKPFMGESYIHNTIVSEIGFDCKPHSFGDVCYNAYITSIEVNALGGDMDTVAERLKESRGNAARVRKEQPDYDRASYNRGYVSTNLEGGDARGEPDAWYDGFMDLACGRRKWHRPLCENHHNGPGGCGLA